jgi:hypothetical protein
MIYLELEEDMREDTLSDCTAPVCMGIHPEPLQ